MIDALFQYGLLGQGPFFGQTVTSSPFYSFYAQIKTKLHFSFEIATSVVGSSDQHLLGYYISHKFFQVDSE